MFVEVWGRGSPVGGPRGLVGERVPGPGGSSTVSEVMEVVPGRGMGGM